MSNNYFDISMKAAQWWADRVSKPRKHDNGALDEDSSALAGLLADSLFVPLSSEQIETFKFTLFVLIRYDLELNDSVSLKTDYSPCSILSYAANRAGIPLTNFPWKTGMWIYREGTIRVMDGYGAQINVL